MEEMIILLYFGSVVTALIFCAQFGSAKISLLQAYVPSTLIVAGIIILLNYSELQSYILPDDNDYIIALFCLMFPFGGIALFVLLYQLFHFLPEPGKITWFGFAILSLLTLIASPLLALFLPYEGNLDLADLLKSFDLNFLLGLGYLVMVIVVIGFTPSVSHQPLLTILKFVGGGVIVTAAFAILWYWFALANNDTRAKIVYPIFFSLPLGVVALLTLIDLARKKGKRLIVGGMAIAVSLLMVWSPYIGSVTVFEACNAIHRRQLKPVIEGLHRYHQDSARYPLEVKALIPYYLAAPPSLFCLGTVASSYKIQRCEGNTYLRVSAQDARSSLFYSFKYQEWAGVALGNLTCADTE